MPVFRFLGDKVTRSGSERRTHEVRKHMWMFVSTHIQKKNVLVPLFPVFHYKAVFAFYSKTAIKIELLLKYVLLLQKNMWHVYSYIHKHREKAGWYNQWWWLNQFDALIKKAAGDIASHLCPLVCLSVSICVCVCEKVCACMCVCKCQWAIKQLVVYAGGHHCEPPPPTLSESQSMLPWCAHGQSLPPLYSPSALPPPTLCFFVYFTQNVSLPL